MSIELEAPPRRFRRPVRRFYGRGYYGGPVYQDPVVIEVERTPAGEYRVISTNSWGTTVELPPTIPAVALEFFKNRLLKSTASRGGGVNMELELQRRTGSGWQTVLRRNSQDWLSATTARGRAGYG